MVQGERPAGRGRLVPSRPGDPSREAGGHPELPGGARLPVPPRRWWWSVHVVQKALRALVDPKPGLGHGRLHPPHIE